MRRAVWLLVFGILAAALGVGSARADGAGTSTTPATTTTGATTTTPTPSYAPLAVSSLPAGCVGAGAAAIVPPSHSPVALGTPASNLGPSGYPASASVVAFGSATASGSTCRSAQVTLASVSLIGGAVTATSVEATDGKGTVAGLAIDGSAVSATAGQTVPVDSWGQLTLGATVGRLTAPLVIRLLQAHDGLLAGTTVAVAFAAAAEPVAKPKTKHHSSASTHAEHKTLPRRERHGKVASAKRKHRHRQPQKPPPDFPAAPDPFLAGGALTDVAQHNPVVSIAAQYLGVPYLWGGARPKTGFDCSGLVQYVFGRLGVSLPHYAAAQYYSPDTVWVAPNHLEPGDLVFFTGSDGTRKEPGHVGIYVGDGYLIDAPHTGALVRVDSLDERWFANKYVGARKVISPLHEVRDLLHVGEPGASTPGILRVFPQQIGLGIPPESAVPISAAAFRSASSDYPLWVGTSIGGLLILLLPGTLVFRRRGKTPDAPPGSAPPTSSEA
jgi:cell wall-associated NlpC family hydrolase